MSLVIETDEELRDIYANKPVDKTQFEVIELGCPWFSKTYYLQYFNSQPMEIPLENGETVIAEYSPMNVQQSSSNEELEYERNLNIQMVNDIIASEITRRDPAEDFEIFPYLKSRNYVIYRDGTISSKKGPTIQTKVIDVTRDDEGATITTSTSPTNRKATGEVTTVTRVPMLKSLL